MLILIEPRLQGLFRQNQIWDPRQKQERKSMADPGVAKEREIPMMTGLNYATETGRIHTSSLKSSKKKATIEFREVDWIGMLIPGRFYRDDCWKFLIVACIAHCRFSKVLFAGLEYCSL